MRLDLLKDGVYGWLTIFSGVFLKVTLPFKPYNLKPPKEEKGVDCQFLSCDGFVQHVLCHSLI